MKLYRSNLSKGFNSSIYGFLFQLEIDHTLQGCSQHLIRVFDDFTKETLMRQTLVWYWGSSQPNNSCLFHPILISFLLEKQKLFKQTHHFYHLFVTATFRKTNNISRCVIRFCSLPTTENQSTNQLAAGVTPLVLWGWRSRCTSRTRCQAGWWGICC